MIHFIILNEMIIDQCVYKIRTLILINYLNGNVKCHPNVYADLHVN